MKTCTKCKVSKQLRFFTRDSNSKNGKNRRCKLCCWKSVKIWRIRNPDKQFQLSQRYYYKHIDEMREYRKRNAKKISNWKKEYRQGKGKVVNDSWERNNPGKVRASAALHRAKRLKRIPSWANLKAIAQFYKNCPKDMVVDHIIPLCGKTVSGLHVLSNLQYLTPTDNLCKSNNY